MIEKSQKMEKKNQIVFTIGDDVGMVSSGSMVSFPIRKIFHQKIRPNKTDGAPY
jgi:hypothetical protein